MALFFQFKTQKDEKDPANVLCSEWHSQHAILAVAMDNFTVSLFNEEGDKYDQKGIAHSNSLCACLAWHPKNKLLVTGWKDGSLIFWNTDDGQKEATPIHADHAITALCWNAQGTRLLSADKSGQLGVWKIDNKNRLTPMIQHKKNGAITHLVFRQPHKKGGVIMDGGDRDNELDMEDLDMEGEDENNPSTKFNKDCTFFFGGQEGVIYLADDNGNIQPCSSLESPIAALLYYNIKDGIVCLTQGMQLAYWTLDSRTQFNQVMKVKISASQSSDGGACQVMWVGPGLLVTSNNESVLRFWNLEKDENYLLEFNEKGNDNDSRKMGLEKIVCIAYNRRKRVLASAIKDAKIVFWQFVGTDESISPDDWEPFAEIDVEPGVHDIQCGPGENLLSCSLPDSVSILHETILKRKMTSTVSLVQLSPEQVFVETLDGHATHTVKTDLRVKGLDLYGRRFCVWDGKKIELYEVKEDGSPPVRLHEFQAESTAVALHSEFIFIANSNKVGVHNHQAHVVQSLQFSDMEGSPVSVDVHGDYLAVATEKHVIRLWRLGREARAHGFKKNVFESSKVEITSVKINYTGTKVSVLAKIKDDAGHTTPDTKIYVYDVEGDKLHSYDFAQHSRYPVSHCWDATEPRLLGCETRRFGALETIQGGEEMETSSRIEVATMFVSSDKGAVLQDSFPLDRTLTALVGLAVPSLYFYTRYANMDAGRETHMEIKPMPNFEKIDCTDPKVKQAMLNFSFFLTMGNMDEAYKAVKTIKDENVWHSMAQMCVKTKRLDVAEMCLGNMQDAKAARALREAKSERETEAQVAMLAIHLNMVDEAAKLYKQCKRYDLLDRLYMACGKWDLALQTAEVHDRIHLRTIHYQYARFQEVTGDLDSAVQEYEASRNHRYEVPRMLCDHAQFEELERYVQSAEDKELTGWWAQYQESQGQYHIALQYYEQAEDVLSRVRLHCFMDEMEEARIIVEQTSNPIAAHYLARQYEDQGNAKEAINFFTVSKSFRHAISIAKEQDMDTDVMQLALRAGQAPLMLDAATYFENKGMEDKAVLLYQRGGSLSKAIMLCVKGKLFDVLTSIADDLDDSADPDVFMRCADFFLENEQYQKAAKMFINAKAFERALQICLEREVKLTDEMAESMTLPKTDNEDDEAYRIALLKKVAKVAKIQESYHLACKKYTQAGDKMKAMQMLLKSGDKEKIMFFAQHSRQPDIYVMAANFLQNLDWHNDPEIMKTIISFYTKARALDSLATFYDACAQVEIDEYRDYEKALAALKEAQRYLGKSKAPDKESKLEHLTERIAVAERFVRARGLVKTDPEEMIAVCNSLLTETDIEQSVRVGDVFALLVEYHTTQGDHQSAYTLIEKMRDRNIVLSYYLEESLVEFVYKQMGIDMGTEEEGVDEAIPEEDV
uniref:Guanine nucleotide-binding protein subunit beta-like protein n=1 Tax=Eutreptiella gymnastica TaxID=73025 RepID=A0A7S1IHP5_9EUGL|mmetsp:Transcript_19364/g.34289  ORF Transcript_19364/g.34289 Transcript_19364/m.34289 type:complete len:1403 (+) Transcript_19364:91-4299(+)